MTKMYLSEASNSYPNGVVFSEDVLINTDTKQINVVSAIIDFNPADFEVTIDTSTSAFPMEMFSKVVSGKITIVRGLPQVGVAGAAIIAATLKIKGLRPVVPTSDNFKFEFTSGNADYTNICINDGLGTIALDSVVNSRFTIKKKSDLNLDGVVNVADLTIAIGLFGNTTRPPADINQDGKVNIKDLSIILHDFD
jgi:hypothetical protein